MEGKCESETIGRRVACFGPKPKQGRGEGGLAWRDVLPCSEEQEHYFTTHSRRRPGAIDETELRHQTQFPFRGFGEEL